MGKLKNTLPPLTCTRGDICVWFNFQTICLVSICLAAMLAGASIIAVTVICDGPFSITVANGTLACGNNMGTDLEDGEPQHEHRISQNLTLGEIMRIVLVLVILCIILIITIVSIHRVILRERHKELSGQLTKLMEKNGVEHLVKGGSQVIYTHEGCDNIV